MTKKLTETQEAEARQTLRFKTHLYKKMGTLAAACGELGMTIVFIVNSVLSALNLVWWIELPCIFIVGIGVGVVISKVVHELSYKFVAKELSALTTSGKTLNSNGEGVKAELNKEEE